MKTVEIRAVHGIRNDVSPERFSHDDLGKLTTYSDLLDSVNLDLDESGKLELRGGVLQLSAVPSHSLWSDNNSNECYVVVNNVLSFMDRSAVVSPCIPAITITGARVAYAKGNDSIYCSDNVSNYQLDAGTAQVWGIAVPAVPILTATTGSMRAGTYMCSTTYVRAGGEESGAPVSAAVTITANGGVIINGLSVSVDPAVTTKRVYLSDANGETLYLALTLRNSDTSALISAPTQQGMPLRTQFFGPLPAGQVVGVLSGRMYVASGSQLWYSAPYEYGLRDLRSGYVTFDEAIRTFAPVSDGVFVGTTSETYWLGGTDPTEFKLEKRAAFGTVLGTERAIRSDVVLEAGGSGSTVCWMGLRGACFGFAGGEMKNMTGALYQPPEATEGAGLLKIRGGTPQYLVTLFA